MSEQWEVVLPVSGRFAKMRELTMADVFSKREFPSMVEMIAMTTTVDGERLTVDEVGEMTMQEAMPLINRLNALLAGHNSNGVA